MSCKSPEFFKQMDIYGTVLTFLKFGIISCFTCK